MGNTQTNHFVIFTMKCWIFQLDMYDSYEKHAWRICQYGRKMVPGQGITK